MKEKNGKLFAAILAAVMSLILAFSAFAATGSAAVKEDSGEESPWALYLVKDEVPENEVKLTGLKIDDISMRPIFSGFSPDTAEYDVNVQDDIYGVRITPKAAEGVKITVNDEELTDGSYLLQLPQGIDDYFEDQTAAAVIKLEEEDRIGTYTVNVVRKKATDVYDLFEEKCYEDEETGLTLPYELYVPGDYDATRKYPVVLVLHGAGQRLQPLYMLLARYQEATAWAVDSEAGHNQCIVVSPQVTAAEGNGWTEFMKPYDKSLRTAEDIKAEVDPYELQDWGIAAHNLLKVIEDEYSVDTDRVYATGLSMGGFGSYALAVAYPEDFAAISPVCGGLDPEQAAVLAENEIAVWHTHSKDDDQVLFDDFGQTSIDAMEAAGVEYRTQLYEPGEVFYPGPHFSWTAAYANREMRDWIFAHSKAENADLLSGLKIDDISMKPIFSGFDPAAHTYTVSVQEDIYGVRITPKAAKGAKITINGEKVKAGGSYLLQLPQGLDDYFKDQERNAIIKVSEGKKSATYIVSVERKKATGVYDLFEEKYFEDEETGLTLPYEIYVPSDYDETKKYPVMLVLHGAGQRLQPPYMLLARYQEATAWAVDSEKGHNQCIVISPQVTKADGNGWTDFLIPYDKGLRTAEDMLAEADPYKLQDWSIAAYNLLHAVEDDYSVDTDRVYATGLSMGGFGSYAMAAAYPEEFAAIAPICGGLDPEKAEVLAENRIAVWHAHSKDDDQVLFDDFGQPTIDAMEAAGVEYQTQLFEPGEVFYPGPHFSWTPAYANQEMRDWIFAHSKAENADLLSGLKVEDISMKPIFEDFDPATHTYTVNVQDDIYGVKITPEAGEGAKITVNGEELTDGSYLLLLPQGLDDYFRDQKKNAIIKVEDGDKTGTYIVSVVRKKATEVYDLFKEKYYEDEETGLTLPYELYIPSDYDSSKKYPLMLVLHGAGQRLQPPYMLLARYQEATAWAVDSEAGHNQCIVLSPQVTEADGNGWTDFLIPYDKGLRTAEDMLAEADPYKLQDWSIAAYNLMHEIEKEYSVDTDRVYATGLSMGGFGSYAMAAAYPEEFAAIAPVCGGLDPEKAEVLAENKIAVWHAHSKDDDQVLFDDFGQPTIDAMEAAGVEYKTQLFEPGEVFYPGPHFSWVPAYANQEMRDWIFEHSKE